MSYANLVNQACASNAETFKRLRDFLCRRNGSYDYSATGIGWTLHDAVYATDQNTVAYNDYFVAYSPGEDGDQDIYLKITYASGYINVHPYLYWNASTHTGVTAATTASNWTATDATAMTLWVYGDLDAIVLVSKIGTTYYGCHAGHCPDSQFATAVATSAAAVAAGSNVVVSVDEVPAAWSVGRKIYIRDHANIEICTITAISGATVTLASVAASYLAGCKLQGEVSVLASSSMYFFTYGAAFIITHDGTKSTALYLDSTSGVSACTADGLIGGSVLSPVTFSASTSIIGPIPHMYSVSYTGRTAENTETDNNGVTYRYFPTYGGNFVVREV